MSEKLEIPSVPALSWIIVALLILCNVFLIKQNLQLKTTVEELAAQRKVQVGEKFSAFNGFNLENQPVTVDFNEGNAKTILLYSSTTCPFCKKQNPYWNDVIKQIDNQKYQVLEIFHEKEDKNKVFDYLRNNNLDNGKSSLKVLFLPDRILQKYKLNSTPVTLIVGENGIVENAWFGLWNKSIITEVNSSLNVLIQPGS